MDYKDMEECLSDINKLIRLTSDVIKSVTEDVKSVRSEELRNIHKNYVAHLRVKYGCFGPEDIIGGEK